MADKTSVVTAERFAQGLSYETYLAQINVNKDRFELYNETAKEALVDEDVVFFREAAERPGGAAKVLVIGEDWCPDVFRGMPLMARIAEVAGMEMQVFPRDTHMDIMNEFLNKGEFLSIPVFVFYTKDQEYLCHWIERPVQANEEMPRIREQVQQELAGKDEQEVRQESRARTNARFPAWQRASVLELRDLLSNAIGG